MIKFEFNKLIRHKIQGRMLSEGVTINSSVLSPEEYILKLKEKLFEEVGEVESAEKLNDLKTELADVLEVIYALASACKINFSEIEKARLEKREVNGEFMPNNYINYIEVEEHNTKVINYLRNKDRHYKLEG